MKNIKELLKTVGGVIASASSITGLHAYKMSLEQRAEYQRKVADLDLAKAELENRIREHDLLQNENSISKAKLEGLKGELDEAPLWSGLQPTDRCGGASIKNFEKSSEMYKRVEESSKAGDSSAAVNSDSPGRLSPGLSLLPPLSLKGKVTPDEAGVEDEIMRDAEKIAVRSSDHRPQKSNELLDVFDKKTNFWNDGNWPGSFKDLMDYFNNLYAQLSGEQIAALLHLSTSFLILICITSIIGIVYGDILIKYLKLEERYPRLAKFIVLRRKFQQFYLFIHFFIILMTLFALIYINIYALILL